MDDSWARRDADHGLSRRSTDDIWTHLVRISIDLARGTTYRYATWATA
jgi:hypothetical protein